jgi:predicted N-acetyltransferase YhbS
VTTLRATRATLRPAVAADADVSGPLIYEAFRDVATRHGFEPAFRSPQEAAHVAKLFIDSPSFFSVVAEADGRLVGAIFHDEADAIHGVALVAVHPEAQASGVGRRLMDAALARARGARGVRLIQEAFNLGAMALYAKLGFEVREPLVRVRGTPRDGSFSTDVEIRRLALDDLEACGALSERVHGFTRNAELAELLTLFSAFAAFREGRIVAYTWVLAAGVLGWGIAESEESMQALLGGLAARLGQPLVLILPVRQAGLFRWCLDNGFRAERPLTLMTMGEYRQPQGCWFPSGIY